MLNMNAASFLCYACGANFQHSSTANVEVLNCVVCGSDVIEKLQDEST